MNYVIEGNINFSEQLMKMLTEEQHDDDDVCLISGDKLVDNFVKLDCGHTFNYSCLLNELINQRKKNALETHKTGKNQIKCPYCRNIHKGILPWYDGYKKLLNVNWNENIAKKQNTCIAILKSGKRKGEQCGCYAKYGNYCGKHKKYYEAELSNVVVEIN
tara:strand:+ start:2964 stop:3443 length:480 start_codon:yes stop_codon:yes gene_type:complete